MRVVAVAFALIGLIMAAQVAVPAENTTLELPRPLGPGEYAWIEVEVGPMPRGQEIDVRTASGRELGVVSPFGVRLGQEAGTYTLPIPSDEIREGRISLRLTVTRFGTSTRAPTSQEVRNVRIVIGRTRR